MNALSKKIALLSDDPIDGHVIAQGFENHPDRIEFDSKIDENDARLVIARHKQAKNERVISLDDAPTRIGAIIDQVEAILLRPERDDRVSYKDYALEWKTSLLTFDHRDIELTDREKEIIYALIAAQGEGCDRDGLLQSIWEYRTDLETHTLETHIYRLRQKIETDPANPVRLLTADNGYCLK